MSKDQRPDCVFCDGRKLPQEMERFVVSRETIMVFEPLNPVVPGHLLVVPMRHVRDAAEEPLLTSLVMHVAAQVAQRYEAANIITSRGEAATQSVFHLHLHVVPWTDQPKKGSISVSKEDLTHQKPRVIDVVREEMLRGSKRAAKEEL